MTATNPAAQSGDRPATPQNQVTQPVQQFPAAKPAAAPRPGGRPQAKQPAKQPQQAKQQPAQQQPAAKDAEQTKKIQRPTPPRQSAKR